MSDRGNQMMLDALQNITTRRQFPNGEHALTFTVKDGKVISAAMTIQHPSGDLQCLAAFHRVPG